MLLFAGVCTLQIHAQQTDPDIQVSEKTVDGRYKFVKFKEKQAGKPAKDTSVAKIKFLLGLSAKHGLRHDHRPKDQSNNRPGTVLAHYERLHQYFNGVKVEYGSLTAHSKEGSLTLLSGEYYQLPDNFSTTPVLTERAAFDKAIAYMAAKKYSWDDPAFQHPDIKGKPKG